MEFIHQKKFLIFSIIFFVFFCIVFVLLYKNILNNEEIASLAQEKWQTEATRRENIKNLFNSVKAIEKERNLLDTHFVKSSDIVPFLDTIEKLANAVNLKSEVSSVDIAKDSSSLMVEMKVSGTFENIYKLITLLENSQYELDFTSLNILNLDSFIDKKPMWNAILQIKLLSFTK